MAQVLHGAVLRQQSRHSGELSRRCCQAVWGGGGGGGYSEAPPATRVYAEDLDSAGFLLALLRCHGDEMVAILSVSSRSCQWLVSIPLALYPAGALINNASNCNPS